MIISTENRATMMAYRKGRSLEEFLGDMWERREAEKPREAKPSGAWPFVRASENVVGQARMLEMVRFG